MYGLARDGKTDRRGLPKGLSTLGSVSLLGETFPPRRSPLYLLAGLLAKLGRRAEKKGHLAALLKQYVQY